MFVFTIEATTEVPRLFQLRKISPLNNGLLILNGTHASV